MNAVKGLSIFSVIFIYLFMHNQLCFSKDKISLKIVGNENKAPKISLINGEPRGTLVEILHYLESKSDFEFEIKLYPWKRAYETAKVGGAGIIGLSMTKERLEIFDYSEPIYHDEVVLVVIEGREFDFKTIEDLRGKTVGGTRGASYGDEYDYGVKNIFSLDTAGTYQQKLLKLLNGHLDAVVISPGRYALNIIVAEDPRLVAAKHKFIILPKPLVRDPNYIGFAKSMKNKKCIAELNQLILEGYRNGDIPAIIKKTN